MEHDPDALDDPPLKVLVAESDVDDARDAIEALSEPRTSRGGASSTSRSGSVHTSGCGDVGRRALHSQPIL